MSNVKKLCLCALFTAFVCVCSIISIPIFAVPITLSVFAVTLLSLVLDTKYALISVLGYITLGCIGLPVFSSFMGGVGVLFSYTGGFIYSYIFMTLIISTFAKSEKISFKILGCTIALVVCYACGITHYSVVTHSPILNSLALFGWYVVFDIIKIVLAILLSNRIKNLIK